MREVSLPMPNIKEDEVTDITVTVGRDEPKQYHFRIESFNWGKKDSLQSEKIQNLRQSIVDYDNNYEVIQIYTPVENSEHIQVLFREKIRS